MYYPLDFAKISIGSQDLLVEILRQASYSSNKVTSLSMYDDFSPARVWMHMMSKQRAVVTALFDTVQYSGYSCPCIPTLRGWGKSSSSTLLRSLALQDLSRVARSSITRRLQIVDKSWHDISLAACYSIDIVTIQVRKNNSMIHPADAVVSFSLCRLI